MNSIPGRLSGGGIRALPPDRVQRLLGFARERAGRGLRLKSARYRVTGFRDPDSGAWVSRNPRNGQYYKLSAGRKRTKLRPTSALLKRSDAISLEIEVDRGQGPRIYYTTLSGGMGG